MLYTIPLTYKRAPKCGKGWRIETNFEKNTKKGVPGTPYGVLSGRVSPIANVVDFDTYKVTAEQQMEVSP
jgi:hypothetical protein